MGGQWRKTTAILLGVSMLLAGCTASVTDEPQEIPGCTDPTATNFNPLASADDC